MVAPARRPGRTSARALPGFAAEYRTLLVDQPGFGGSDKPPVVGNYYRFSADAVVALLDELGLEKVHLLGNSLGGGTAMRLALSYPDRVGRLIMMGPGGLSLNLFHADPTEGVQRLMDFGADPTREKLRAFISTMVVNQDLVTDELVEERFADATAPGAQDAMRSMGMSFWNPRRPRTACCGGRRTGCATTRCSPGVARTGSTRSTARWSRSS